MIKQKKVKSLQKIRNEGHSKVLCVTKLLPIDWTYVSVSVMVKRKNSMVVLFDKVE